MPSFDIVSEINMQEVDNAVNQARKELATRYDFRGSKATIDWDKAELSFSGEDDYKLTTIKDILLSKMHRRGVDIKALKFEKPEPMGGQMLKQKCSLVQGIDKEMAKKIIKKIKDSKIKVQPQVQDEKVKVTSKSIDALQECIALCRDEDFGLPLQYTNMRQ